MNALYAITRESFLMLKREKIMIPMLMGIAIIFFLVTFISEWAVAGERLTLYFNITHTALRFVGGIIAVLFSTKMLHDSHISGSLESILSRPIHKITFLLGSYIALISALTLFGIISGISWYGINFLFSINVPHDFMIWGLIFCVVEWCLLGALGYALSSVCRFEIALLSMVLLWILGLLSHAMTTSLENIQHYSQLLPWIKNVAKFWSLENFSLLGYSRGFDLPQLSNLLSSVGYGVACIVFLLALGSMLFHSEDVIR